MKRIETKWLMVLLAIAMMVSLVTVVSAEPDIEANYGFIPNSGEASVSKVELTTFTEVARYYTAQRSDPDPYDWRTSRIAMDRDGNAWVINVGADGTNLQGSIVRIQADTTGLDTNSDPLNPKDFSTDQAVQVFPVGEPGEMPRAIAIDADGYIWVGFYSGGYLQKYRYDEDAPLPQDRLTPIGDQFQFTTNIKFYEMKFAPDATDGTLWISSRSSTPDRPGTQGIFSFNGTTFTLEREVNPYSLLIADDGTVYATAYSNELHIRDPDTGAWSVVIISGSSQNRGMAFDDYGRIWIASTVGTTGGTVVYSYNITAKTPGPTYTLTNGTTPVGVGKDAAGNMWAVCRSDAMAQGWIEGFNPENQDKVGAIQVGHRPYAYGDFVVVAPPKGKICGTKYEDFWTGVKNRETIGGWIIYLFDEELVELAQTETDEYGNYCFENLQYGTYYVYEQWDDCYASIDPASGFHEVELNSVNGEVYEIKGKDFVNRRGKIQGIKVNWDGEGTFDPQVNPISDVLILLYKGEPANGEPNVDDAFKSTTTDDKGFYAFDELCPDIYYVYEKLDEDWKQTYPASGFYVVELEAGVRATGKHFGNRELIEKLTVTKTVETSFTREHFWDIAKKVETENGLELDGIPKIWLYTNGDGNETATWKVDVTYDGFKDREFKVNGTITIENTGDVDAVITGINDFLAGTLINVDFGVTFPYTLPFGDTLTCTYEVDVEEKVEVVNEVTVTTERDEYFADAEIVWCDDPTTEINKTVTIVDDSEFLEEEDELGTATAPYGVTYTYDKDFAWADYGADNCGSFAYDNTATIFETEQSASATLKVNVQKYVFDGETAWAANGTKPLELRYTDRGNWATYVKYEAGKKTTLFAGQTIPVGEVTFSACDGEEVTITVTLADGWDFEDVGENLKVQDYEIAPSGNPAPGRFDHKFTVDSEVKSFDITVPCNNFYGVHVNVGQWIPDPTFGPLY
ncbi:sugar lactone lactonase YvrE [Methanocalculus alkaliphilus]|uniref:hypothetical protein n=1 Tax=Methanocalculus alkaliphilus TaxID=768730 RepID=UPI0020A02684|nr:hypothetical protein [Methanocalculus alkaliphilus]MCP1715408.1 sugar lactone lactonase YvrE [Methanocalculus alkaliphilus]